MQFTLTRPFKSLTPFALSNLPRFMVITGPNGCGKSQLLDLIAQTISQPTTTGASIAGEKYESNEILFLTSEWSTLKNVSSAGFAAVQSTYDSLWNSFGNFARHSGGGGHLRNEFIKACTKIGKPAVNVTKEEFIQHFDLSAPLNRTAVFNETIAHAFFDYRLRQVEASESGRALEEIPPWELLREIISTAELPFEFEDPGSAPIRSVYQFQLRHTIFDCPVNFPDLSSGEKVLLSLVFWLFHVKQTGIFPRLLLLDEPDAHLHPRMCRQFIDVVHGVLVERHGVRALITTHNPTTVALSPRESLFEMRSTGERLRKSLSKSDAIRQLTDGLVTVSEAKIVVIVEDEDDQKFYQFLFDELTTGHSDENGTELSKGEPLVFVQASKPRADGNRQGTSGGRSQIEKWVPKLRSEGIDTIVGLVDRDGREEPDNSVYALTRYSIENFLVDPIIVFCTLVAESQAPEIAGIATVSADREHTVTSWKNTDLQKVADSIASAIRLHLDPDVNDPVALDETPTEVSFINGARLYYPRWLLDSRGKDLLSACIKAFGGQYVNLKKLTKTFRRLMFVPTELVELLRTIQSRQ